MQKNHSAQHASSSQSLRLVNSQEKEALRLVPDSTEEQDGPDRDNVVSMLRRGVGSVLDGLGEAQAKVRDARRLHEIAVSVGDEQVVAMLGHELGQVVTAARISGPEPDQPAPRGAKAG